MRRRLEKRREDEMGSIENIPEYNRQVASRNEYVRLRSGITSSGAAIRPVIETFCSLDKRKISWRGCGSESERRD